MSLPLEEVSVRYHWTLPEVTEAARWHARQGAARVRQRVLLGLAAVCAVWGAVQYLRHGTMERAVFSLILAFYFFVIFVLVPLIVRWRIRRQHARSTLRNCEIHWVITESSLHVSHVNATSELKWSAFNKAVATPAGLMMFTQPNMFNWMPRHAFAPLEGFETVASWARQHVPTFKELK